MADPLSTATRATKRNLLVASVLAISANAFSISFEKIPIAGLSISFDDRVFGFLLLVVLAYFLCTFVLYYTIDIKNLDPTPHQDRVQKALLMRLNGYPQRYTGRMQKDLEKLAPTGSRFMLEPNFYDRFQGGDENNEPGFKLIRVNPPSSPPREAVFIERRQEEEAFRIIEARVRDWTDLYRLAAAGDRRRAKFVALLTRLMYFTRNYFFDGILPILLGLISLAAILGLIQLDWIPAFLPSFKSFHHI
jgi:hypothetical protein